MSWGDRWRLLAHYSTKRQRRGKEWPYGFTVANEGRFDELVIDNWFHIEQMASDVWWIGIYDRPGPEVRTVHIWVRLHRDRPHDITINGKPVHVGGAA